MYFIHSYSFQFYNLNCWYITTSILLTVSLNCWEYCVNNTTACTMFHWPNHEVTLLETHLKYGSLAANPDHISRKSRPRKSIEAVCKLQKVMEGTWLRAWSSNYISLRTNDSSSRGAADNYAARCEKRIDSANTASTLRDTRSLLTSYIVWSDASVRKSQSLPEIIGLTRLNIHCFRIRVRAITDTQKSPQTAARLQILLTKVWWADTVCRDSQFFLPTQITRQLNRIFIQIHQNTWHSYSRKRAIKRKVLLIRKSWKSNA